MRNLPIRHTSNVTTLTAIALAGVLICGCGEGLQGPSVRIGGLLIRNRSEGPLYDVKLKVEKTRTLVTCNYIPAGGSFSTEFPLRQYEGNSVQVSWQQDGLSFKKSNLYAKIPDMLDSGSPAAAVVDIYQTGFATVRLEQ